MFLKGNKSKILSLILVTSVMAGAVPANVYADVAYSFNIVLQESDGKVLDEVIEAVDSEEKSVYNKDSKYTKATARETESVNENNTAQEIVYEVVDDETEQVEQSGTDEEKKLDKNEELINDDEIIAEESDVYEDVVEITEETTEEITEENETDAFENDSIVDAIKEVYEDAYMLDDETVCITLEDGEKIYTDKDDPEMFKHFLEDSHEEEDDLFANEYYANGKTSVSPFTSKKYTHDEKFSSYKILNGIDVSQWNGTIDWKKAKAGGVDFAFIRIGYRGYGDAGNIPSAGDTTGVSNIKAAYNAGVKVGVYFFSQAISVAEGKQEADFCLDYINKNKLSKYISLPVIIDYEYYADKKGRLWNAKLNASEHQAICDSFASTIHGGGFIPGVYANYSMLKDDMHPSRSADYTKYWVARWNTYTGYTGNYNCWQYTDNGTVPGISGAVDCDFYYEIVEKEPEKLPVAITYSLHAPNKTTYNVGEKINLAGAYLLSSNNKKVTVTNSMLSGFSSEEPGVKTVNVDYEGVIYSFDVLVTDYNLSFDAMYGTALRDIELPEVSYGTLSFKKALKTVVGAVGTNKFTVVFTPSDTRFSKREYTGYVTVKYSIGDGINESADVVVSYNEQIAVNKTKISKVINSVRHKVTLKKGRDYTANLITKDAYDENGNALEAGISLESENIPKGYTGTFKLVIDAGGNYLGKIEKNIYVSEKAKLLKNSSISLGAKLKNIDYVNYDETMFIPAVYDSKTKTYYKVENREVTDTALSKEESQYAFTVKISNKYLIMGKDFEVESYGSRYVGNQNFTVKGIGSYLGIKKSAYKIKGKILTASKVIVEGIENKIYDGDAKFNDEIIVKYKDSAKSDPVILEKDRDYAITYSDNTNPGTAKMSITGLVSGGYSGKVLKSFKILAK